MKFHQTFRKNAIAMAVTSATLMAGAAPSVYAQDVEGGELEEVIVTGSRLKRVDLTSVTPVSVVTGEEFKISGNLNIEQKLAELGQTLPAFGPSSNNPGNGTATVNLRGLGTARTLVLVNGRRYLPSTQTGVVDLNTIPSSLIKQVDITTGGASAVYGSDALSGVVNFQLVDNFEGAEFSTLYDITSDGDGDKFNFDFTVGGNFDEGRGNAVIYGSYSERDPVFQGDRDFSTFALQDGDGELVPGGSSGVPGTRVFGGPTLPNGDNLGIFNADGSGRSFQDPADRFNYAPDNFLQLPQERFLTTAIAHYDLTESVRAYSEFTYVRNEVPQELAPTPAFLGFDGNAIEVNPNSAFFAPDVQAALNSIADDNGNAFLPAIGRRFVENGSRESVDTRTGSRILLGFKGDLTDNWSYDVYYSTSQLDLSNQLNNDVSETRLRQALLVNDAGTACQDPSGGCAPINIFGEGNISQAAVDFVNVGATNITDITQEVINASVAGTLGSIGASQPVGLVVGFEYRDDESSFRPDEFLSSGDVLGFNAGDATVGSFDVTEIFGEISLPITDNFEAWGAYRYSDYSNIGGVSSFATALTYSPTSYARVRAGFQQAVRAPNVSELFQGQSNGFPGAADPCAADGFVPGVTDVALCQASGVPAALVGNFNQPNTQIEGLFGGNPDLEEETSDTFTLGVVLEPTDNISVTVDYFDIEIEDAISVLGGSVPNVLDICFNQGQDISSPFCQAVNRGPGGLINFVEVLNENIGLIETSGIDVAINYTTDLNFGFGSEGSTLSITTQATFLDTFDVTPVATLPTVNECAGTFGDTCGTPRNETIVNTRATWSSGNWAFSGLLRYLSSVDDDRIANTDTVRSDLVVPELDDEFYLDLSASYNLNDEWAFNFGIKNVFDTEPTPIGSAQQQGNTFPEVYDLLGTRFFFNANYKFR